MHAIPGLFVTALLCLAIAPANAAAAAQPAAAGSQAAVAATANAKSDSKSHVDDFGPRADMRTLAAMSGGTDVHQQTTLNGNVSDNHNDHVSTGFNTIGNGAFNGAAGVSTVIQNTGNSVLIQDATIINVQFKP